MEPPLEYISIGVTNVIVFIIVIITVTIIIFLSPLLH